MVKVWQRARALVERGAMPKPAWYDVVEMIPPLPYPGRLSRPKNIVYPEDRIRRAFYAKFKDQEASPFYDDSRRSMCDRFVDHAVSLMRKGMTQDEAIREASAAYATERADEAIGRNPSSQSLVKNLLADLRKSTLAKAEAAGTGQSPPAS